MIHFIQNAQAFENESLLFTLANGSQLNLIKIYFILPLDILIKPLMQKSLIQKRKSPFCNSFILSLRGKKKHMHTTPGMCRLTVFFKHTSSIFNILELLHTRTHSGLTEATGLWVHHLLESNVCVWPWVTHSIELKK